MSAKIAAALVAAQSEMPAVEKNATNPHFGSRFVSLDHLIAKTKPVLTKNELVIVQLPSDVDGVPGLRTMLLHSSGEYIEATVPLVLGKQDMQGLGGALTYARRYGWASVLGICDETDDDGNQVSAAHGVAAERAAVTAPKAEPPAAPTFKAPDTGMSGEGGDWVWPTGKHQGVKLADTPLDYVTWYSTNGPKQDVKQRCATFLAPAGSGSGFYDTDIDGDSIPF